MTTTLITEDHVEALLSVRIVTLDYYMSPPLCPDLDPVYSSYRSTSIKRLPILRIFGPTLCGQKTCLHIHGVFPYLYIRLPSGKDPDEFGYRLTMSLDKALNMVLGAGSNTQHVFKVVPVKAKSMYGYHEEQNIFLKIYLYNPGFIKKVADLLHNGAVMDEIIEPYESHVPFTLQFMMDYNLQGMNLVHLSHAFFRLNLEEASSLGTQSITREDLLKIPSNKRIFNVKELSSELHVDSTISKSSRSALEIDSVATDLLNKNAGANPGLNAMWEDEVLRRRSKQLDEKSIPNPSSPPRGDAQTRLTESEKFWYSKFKAMIKDSSFVKNKGNPSEKNVISSLPSSNSLDTHIPSLDLTIGSSNVLPSSNTSNVLSYLNETIINEDVVSSLSCVTLDENDRELIELLAKDESKDDNEAFEMSQICWDSDPFSQE